MCVCVCVWVCMRMCVCRVGNYIKFAKYIVSKLEERTQNNIEQEQPDASICIHFNISKRHY